MKWTDISKLFSAFLENYLKKALVSVVLKVAGLSGGFFTWIAGFFISKGLKIVEKEVASGARLEDQKIVDNKIEQKHEQDLKNDAPESTLIQDETDLLNGGRKP